MHGSIAMKESSKPDQPRFSHVWHSDDCSFNSALSDRSAGSRILEKSDPDSRVKARRLNLYRPSDERAASRVFVPVSSSIADSYSWVRGVQIPALFAASKYEIPSFPFPTSGFRALAIAKQASFRPVNGEVILA